MSVNMEESSYYQMIFQKGEQRGEQRSLLRLGTKRFGTPTLEQEQALKSITDLERLDRLAEGIFEATSWDNWLAIP